MNSPSGHDLQEDPMWQRPDGVDTILLAERVVIEVLVWNVKRQACCKEDAQTGHWHVHPFHLTPFQNFLGATQLIDVLPLSLLRRM